MISSSKQITHSSPLDSLTQAEGQIQRFTLDNGMIGLIKEDSSAPMVSIQIWVGTGSSHEEEYLGAGLSHAIEHMIFKGTEKRKTGDITKEIDDAGGFINAYTSLDRTVFFVDIPSDKWKTGLDVLADALMNANFPENEWNLEREVIIREMAMNRDSPDRELSSLIRETAYATHPHKVPVIGYEEVFKTITRSDLLVFFRRHYTPNNTIVSIAGDINAKEAESALRETFSEFKRRAGAPVLLPREPAQLSPRQARSIGPHQISRLALAWHTVALDHPDAPALDILATIVSNGRSSRLEQEIKEKQKLAHAIGAHSFTPKEPGLFLITAGFSPENEKTLIEAIELEIANWTSAPFGKEDIKKAKRQNLTAVLSTLQTMNGQASSAASGEFYGRDPAFSTTYLRRLESVTAEDILNVARRYLRTENRTLAIISPEPEAQAQAELQPAIITAEIQKFTLRNGVTLLVKEDHRLPFVSFCAAFTGGLILENENNNGITQLMSEMMTRGTHRRSSLEIAQTVEALGGSISAFSGQDSFGLTAQCLSEDSATFIEILADSIINPTFNAEEMERQKIEQLSTIARQMESPIFIGLEALRETLFPGHPYRLTSEGSKQSVESISVENLREFHRKTVISGNIVIAVFGDISAKDARQLVERHTRNIPSGMRPALECPTISPELPATLERRAPKEQTIIMKGFPGVKLNDKRKDALMVLQSALSGLSSDLMMAIRDERGLAYFAGAFQRAGLEPGMFVIYAGIHETAVKETSDLIDAETARLAQKGLRPEEFERAKSQIISRHKQRAQLNHEMAQECALNELFGLGYDYAFNIEERMNSLTQEAIIEAAASIMSDERKAVSTVLPAEHPANTGEKHD